MTQRHVLDARSFPLHGSRLIEASAGTGKTWTIAALYVRLVLGHGGEHAFGKPLMPADILVMTFTRAATRELSDRIRARLVQAAAYFRGQVPEQETPDPFLLDLMAAYPEGPQRERAAWQLAMAAESMDDAAIFTIDAWCQRMLREHAFDSGNLFDETLESDESQRLVEAAQDYWRQQCYPLQGQELAMVLQVWKSFADCYEALRSLRPEDMASFVPDGQSLQQLVQQAQAAQQALVQPWKTIFPRFRDWLLQQVEDAPEHWNSRRFSAKQVQDWVQALGAWVEAPEVMDFWRSKEYATARQNLRASAMPACRLKNAPPLEVPPQAHAFEELAEQMAQLPDLRVQMLAHAAAYVHQRMQWLKQQTRTFGFADMLERLDQALSGENGPALRQRILAQYPVALIDEFQDTSPLQYRLFDQIYRTADNDPESALLLIGDPKQSIYGFRGADIYSYLRAREATEGRHYVLDVNYRSTEAVVHAVNRWFAQAEARAGAGAFMFREAQRNPLPFDAVRAKGRAERFQMDGQPVPAMTVVWHEGQGELVNTEAMLEHMSRACAEQIVRWLNDAKVGFAEDGKPLQRLRPRDIAVLVRTGKQAAAVRRELQRRHVASVYLSDQESVFASVEAQDVLVWLRAVAAPRDARAVRAGLATGIMGLTLEQLAWLAADDEAFDAKSQIVAELHSVWQMQGVLAMLRQTLHRMQLPALWLAETWGERRLTNYLHLAELLQNASATLEGEQALIRWLAMQIEAPGQGSEEQVVRLESDEDLVKVVTVHKSKGLEYPVVLLPFAADFREYSDSLVRVPQPDGRRSVDLQPSTEAKQQADKERLREDIRLLYVALTRPRHAIWVGISALSKHGSKKCVNHKGACGYLLNGGQEASVQGWRDALQALAEGCSDIRVEPLPAPSAPTLYRSSDVPPPLCVPQTYDAQFDTQWSIASFTRLVRGKSSELPVLPVAAMQPADDERALDASSGRKALLPVASSAVWHRFMRGELVGNFIHEQLEWLEGEDFALEADGQGRLSEQLLRRCERAGRTEQAQDTLQWLRHVVHHPLPPLGCSLAQIRTRLPEMEFWLPIAQLPAREVDALCRQFILPEMERPMLPDRSLHGMLMGFADLVFVHEGRYWVLDYKTNYLGTDGSAYHAAALQQAMLQHRYDVQAALYLLALHSLLQSRLGEAYDPAQQLGGALYFFLRGMDGPAQGVHVVPPMLELLEALQALINEVQA